MANLTLKCLEDDDLELEVEEQDALDGAPAVLFTVGGDVEGVLLSDRSVAKLIDYLEDWRVKNAKTKD